MPEIRQNIATKDWVIIATERAKRPEDFVKKVEKKVIPEFVQSCPFCPGNESKTPPETLRIGKDDKWQVRVIPNKFGALSNEGESTYSFEGLERCTSGVGVHEVIIETPLHHLTTAILPVPEVESIIQAYLGRYQSVSHDSRIEHIIIFKNHGESAGTSLEHPHSQMVGLPIVPSHVRHRVEEAMRYFDDHGECVFCTMLKEEIASKERIVFESNEFVAFLPYAAFSPFHIWVLPKRHAASFVEISPAEISDLAYNLRTVLAKIYHGLDNPDYNYVLNSAPLDTGSKYLHWYISIVPRVSKAAGFELGSGMFINAALPEKSAEFLRT
ncbi:MAG: galactose-1-phosphate uridylyltransferase [Planctomycetota bacterium]